MALRPAPGSDGVIAPGAFLLDTGERNSKLQGSNVWRTQDNLLANITIIASSIGIWLDLGGSSKWTAVPNPRGGKDAVLAAELVQDGVLDARMPTKWRSVVKRQLPKRFKGFAMHAKGWRRDPTGRIVLAELAHRPQWSIERWVKPTETAPWSGVIQRTRMGAEFPIDRRDLFYSVEGALSPDPRGFGILRHAVEVADILTRYRQLQGIAFDTDCNGIPLGRAPLAKLAREALDAGVGADATSDALRAAAIASYVRARVAPIADMIENRVVTSNRSLLLDSLPYFATNAQTGQETPSDKFEWSVETIRQLIGSIPELGSALKELNFEIAGLFSTEFLLLGGEGTSGSWGASSDKTSLFATRVNTSLDDVGDDAERDVVPDICERNGITDERCWPTLQHEPVSRTSISTAATMLRDLHAAALKPGDPAENVLRARADLPPAPEVEEEDLATWRAARGAKGQPAGGGGKAGEEGDPPAAEDEGANE